MAQIHPIMDISELEDSAISYSIKFVSSSKDINKCHEVLLECIKELKLICTKGSTFQNLIANTNGMLSSIKGILESTTDDDLKLKSFQLLANVCVQNKKVQTRVKEELGDLIMLKLSCDNGKFVNVASMITHNMLLNGIPLDAHKILIESLRQSQNFEPSPDFLHILLDHFICSHGEIVEEYKGLQKDDKKNFLLYVNDHVTHGNAEPLDASLIHHLSREFKIKSDDILKTVATHVESIDPESVMIILEIIATMTAQEKYQQLLKNDNSLFLNLGCLLQAIHKIGKDSSNIFTPIQKLDAMLPRSEDKAEIESKISYTFKTKLVKALANLSYKNARNQELAREMEIMQSIFECTNADARNPIIKEWSILAIRNLCEGNLENQEIVRNLTRVGDAENPVLKEFGIESGVVRINK